MATFAISMVRDEADIVETTVRHMLTQVDRVIILDNASTDGTRDILNALPVTVIDDPERGYYQSRKMTALASQARRQGAQWVVPFDADELWATTNGWRVADALAALPPHVKIATAALYDHVATVLDDGEGPVRRMRWRRPDPLSLPKVACRALPGLTVHQGNHAATYRDDTAPPVADGVLRVHHFPYRTADQFVRKARNGAAAYAATDLPADVGRHWREYGQLIAEEGDEAGVLWFRRHFFSTDPEGDGLVYDPAQRA